MRKKLEEYLEENGFEAKSHDNEVVFSINQLNFMFRTYPDDPFFFQLILPNIDGDNIIERRDVIADINRRFKVAKIIEVEDRLWIVADSFVFSDENGEKLIARLIRLLTDVINEYRRKTTESEKPEENEEVEGNETHGK